jgi:hypothetical protein
MWQPWLWLGRLAYCLRLAAFYCACLVGYLFESGLAYSAKLTVTPRPGQQAAVCLCTNCLMGILSDRTQSAVAAG